jgi:DNA-binding NtrC family response regulator
VPESDEVTLSHPRYAGREVLGRGAQGVVLRVLDREAPERALVAKIWRAGRFPEAALRGEFALLARLSLPGVVRAHDLGIDTSTGAPFLVEDFVEGADARAWLEQARSEERSQRVRHVLTGVLRALVGLHEAGFLHGDLKPEHVMVAPDGAVVLLDLGGTALAAACGVALGTRGYLAPELLAGGKASVASDLFALGALAFRLLTGASPTPGTRTLRAQAPWLDAGSRELVHELLALHPQDRPADAAEALGRLAGNDEGMFGSGGLAAPIGREAELARLLEHRAAGVTYLTGASGIGKSHLARELWTRALLDGRSARRVTFPQLDETRAGRLAAFFRGQGDAWPFDAPAADSGPLLLVLDALEVAPSDLVEALEGFRCRGSSGAWPLEVVAVRREAPAGAPSVTLGALAQGDFEALAERLGYRQADARGVATELGRGNPGWLLALRGGAPITREMVLERVQGLAPAAREVVAVVALTGGDAPERLLRELCAFPEQGVPEALSAAFSAGLLVREVDQQGVCFRLPSLALAANIAAALASFELVDRVAQALLHDAAAPARSLLAVAGAPCPPALREELLERAARGARTSGLRGSEIDALLALLARAERRSPEILLRLERLLRDAGAPAGHPEVHAWLEQAAVERPELAPLVLRRSAERAARAGETERADALIAEAHQRAAALDDALARGLTFASAGAIALYRADWQRAERELAMARSWLARADTADAEELARLEHNAGVVDLYAERLERAVSAFERSLAIKRSLGDRGGVRACLLNLGLALTKLGRHTDAEAVLDEAVALARSLRHASGEAWCLAARVELELRRGDARAAEHWLAQAERVRDAAPAQVAADLGLCAAQVALLDGDGKRALELLAELPAELLATDASLGAKRLLLEAEAELVTLPARPRHAARLGARALRLARDAQLAEVEQRARGLLSRARPRTPTLMRNARPAAREGSAQAWPWLERVAAGLDAEAACVSLCSLLVEQTGAERALVGVANERNELVFARAADLDGFELPNAAARFDAEFLRSLLGSSRRIHQREVGTGSRIAAHTALADGTRAVVLVEHRFKTGLFDAVEAEALDQWLTLAGLALRLRRPQGPVATPAPLVEDADSSTTREPVGLRKRRFPEIVGQSAELERALGRLDAAIDSRLPVLVLGETGAGKELFARALHERGPRAERPFVAVNCAAIADNLFEAELFGHARGAFTGAERARAGMLAEAEGGTLLLDEIGELRPARQATLLRLLETGRFRPVGGDGERSADVRIVAATNRDLEREVASGGFRRDLLFRLNVLEIRVPSLCERAEDVPLLVQHFLERAGSSCRVSEAAMARLAGYDWPGNVRELEHVIGRFASSGARELDVADLPRAIRRSTPRLAAIPTDAPALPESSQRDEVERALRASGGNITHAAHALGLTRHGLKKRMLRLGLRSRGATNDG